MVAAAQKPSPPGITTFPATPLPGVPVVAAKPILPFAAPLFLTGGRFTSTLSLVNSASAATDAELTLRDLSGEIILTRRIDFKPHSERRIDLGDLLEQSGSSATRGSLFVRQNASLKGRTIMGTLAMTYRSPSGPMFIDEEPPDANVAVSSTLVGVADPSSGAPILAVASLAATVQHITVECFGEEGSQAASQLTLSPGQSSISAACPGQGEETGNADPLFAESSARPHGPLGIRLTSDGIPGAFSAFALAPHTDDGSRSFSSVLFNDPQAAHSPNIVFSGVPVGSASLLPSGTYTPHLSLANFSTLLLHVHIQYTHTDAGDTTTTQEVATVTIDPGASREVAPADLLGDPEMQNSFLIVSDGAPGALGAKFVARGEGPLLRRLELQAKDERSRQNAGGHPWSLEDGTESTLLLFNHDSAAQHFTVAIAGSESWQKTWTLAAMETKAISFRDLIENRTEDDTGRTLLPAVRSGERAGSFPIPPKAPAACFSPTALPAWPATTVAASRTCCAAQAFLSINRHFRTEPSPTSPTSPVSPARVEATITAQASRPGRVATTPLTGAPAAPTSPRSPARTPTATSICWVPLQAPVLLPESFIAPTAHLPGVASLLYRCRRPSGLLRQHLMDLRPVLPDIKAQSGL